MARAATQPTGYLHHLARVSAAVLALSLTGGPATAQDQGQQQGSGQPAGGGLTTALSDLSRIPNFVFDGALRHQGATWELRDFTGQVGDLPVQGSIAVDRSGEKPFVSGSLTAPDFDVDVVRSLLEEAGLSLPDADPPSDKLIPSFELPTAFLDSLETDLDVALGDVTGLAGVVQSARAQVSLDDRRLAFNPLEVRFASGMVTGKSALNARQETASADLVIDFKNVDLGILLEDTAAAEYVSGILNGRVSLLGTGGSLEQVLATSEGEMSFLIEDGWIDGLALEAAGIDVVETLALYLGDSDRIPINCGRVDLVVGKGIAEITRFIVDTRDSLVVGGGTVDLASEELDLGVQTRSRDFSLIDVAAPILIDGTMSDPSFSVGETELLDLFETGDAPPVDCSQLLQADFRGSLP